jgi:hypothetical protein
MDRNPPIVGVCASIVSLPADYKRAIFAGARALSSLKIFAL